MADSNEPSLRVVDRRWWARETEAGERAGEERLRKPTYVEELERQLAEKDAQVKRLLEDHRRAVDEFDQTRIRLRRDVGKEVDRARRTMLTEFLEVVDNLDRAAAAAHETTAAPEQAVERLAKGVDLVRDQFLTKLEALGVARLDVVGRPFDASQHDAVTMTPVDDPARDGLVVAVVKEGYAIGDDLLRPAAVVVGKFDRTREG
jgi:molecular chaperone GrpE